MNWEKEANVAITICDINSVIIEMNDKAIKTFEKYGGKELIGKSLYDCHNDDSKRKIKQIMETQRPNSYTIEKNGIKKLIHQMPWYKGGKFMGLVELAIEIPLDLPHFIRT